jgi:hypothetical protein
MFYHYHRPSILKSVHDVFPAKMLDCPVLSLTVSYMNQSFVTFLSIVEEVNYLSGLLRLVSLMDGLLSMEGLSEASPMPV